MAQVGVHRSQTPGAAEEQGPRDKDETPGSRHSSQDDTLDVALNVVARTDAVAASVSGAGKGAVDDHAVEAEDSDAEFAGARLLRLRH